MTLDIEQIQKLTVTEMKSELKKLKRRLKPVFSGSLDYAINAIDHKKIQ